MVGLNQFRKGLIHGQSQPLVSPFRWMVQIVGWSIGSQSFRGTQYGEGPMVGPKIKLHWSWNVIGNFDGMWVQYPSLCQWLILTSAMNNVVKINLFFFSMSVSLWIAFFCFNLSPQGQPHPPLDPGCSIRPKYVFHICWCNYLLHPKNCVFNLFNLFSLICTLFGNHQILHSQIYKTTRRLCSLFLCLL